MSPATKNTAAKKAPVKKTAARKTPANANAKAKPSVPLTGMRPELATILPEVPPLKAIRLPAVEERTLDNGLRILAARRSGVPRLEARLVIASARRKTPVDAALSQVLVKTLLAGTGSRTSVQIAQELQRLGGNLDTGIDTEQYYLFGSALAGEVRAFLTLFADVVTDATHPDDEVGLQKQVAAQEITLARSQPAMLAREALVGRLYGDHPYGRRMPTPDEVMAVGAKDVRKIQDKRVRPDGSVLVLVGDVPPNKALDLAEAALGGWARGTGTPGLSAPTESERRPTLLVDRPGAVQTNVRIGGPAVQRAHPDYPALALANLVFGGYFVSRLVDNIREKRGYTYSPGSGVQLNRRAAVFVVQADVGTEVTGPALVETRYELNRMLAGPIDEAELISAKRYLSGTMSMSIQTQAGLASQLAHLAIDDLTVDHLRDYPAKVDALTEDDVIAASRKYLDPRRLQTVMVGDAEKIKDAVAAFDDVEVESAAG